MASINPMKLLQIKAALDRFTARHPKLLPFAKAVQEQALAEGTVVEINVTTAEGKRFSTNLRLSAEDMELVREAGELRERSE